MKYSTSALLSTLFVLSSVTFIKGEAVAGNFSCAQQKVAVDKCMAKKGNKCEDQKDMLQECLNEAAKPCTEASFNYATCLKQRGIDSPTCKEMDKVRKSCLYRNYGNK